MDKYPYDVLDLKSLRCFFAVARNGSVTKAGIELNLTEAAVSQRVRALERELGVKLYEARGGRVRLTPAGEHTVSLAISLFDEIKQFEQAITLVEDAGEIVLSSHDEVAGYMLPAVVEAFSRAHPHAHLRLLARPIEETLRLLKANEADLGVVPARDLPKELEFRPIVSYPATFLMPKSHPLARRARADFNSLLNEETLRRYPLVVAEIQLEGRTLKQTLARLKLPLVVGIEVGSIDTVKRYVARGLGVALVSGLCVTRADRDQLDVVDVPRELGAESTYGIVLRRDKHRNPLLNSLLDILQALASRS